MLFPSGEPDREIVRRFLKHRIIFRRRVFGIGGYSQKTSNRIIGGIVHDFKQGVVINPSTEIDPGWDRSARYGFTQGVFLSAHKHPVIFAVDSALKELEVRQASHCCRFASSFLTDAAYIGAIRGLDGHSERERLADRTVRPLVSLLPENSATSCYETEGDNQNPISLAFHPASRGNARGLAVDAMCKLALKYVRY